MTSDSGLPDTPSAVKSGGRGSNGVVLDITDVSKSFASGGRRVQALEDVSLRLERGLVTGLIGPDGAGKTTLMRLVTGLLVPDDGQIMVLGVDVAREPLAVQASVGYMPQRFGLYEDLTVQENLDLYADLQGVAQADRPARYRELMQMTGLARFTTRLARRLSGGMKQKLGLACTLVRAPALLLLDEPTVGVDPVSRRELWTIVYRLVQEEAMTVLLSTAYLDEAERCHQVALLHQGQMLGQGSPASFSAQLQGRTYVVTAPGLKKRALQEILSAHAGVVDAVIQGDRVRLVMANTILPAADTLLPTVKDAVLEPVPPRFEDSFIARLHMGEVATAPAYSTNQRHGHGIAGAAESERVIEVHHVQRRFGSFYAVRDVSFDVCRGEVFGLLGANGAGKSTTFRMLCGLLPPTAGSLRVAGVDLRRAAAHARARIGYMSQKFSLYGILSVRQNLEFFSSAYGLLGSQRAARIAWALQQFELEHMADVSSIDLPLGYKQRLALACSLMHEPEILFLDEPTSGVDPRARREFWRRINLLAEQGVTVLVTTHFMEEAEYCDRLAIMAAGEILNLGTPAEIKRGARSPTMAEPTMEQAFIALIERQQQMSVAS
jgi:drug efflux transport system ATP-binding protein